MTEQPDKPSAGDKPRNKTNEQEIADVGAVAEGPASDLEMTLRRQLDELEELVTEHPLATVGLAAGLGLLVGLIVSRR